jgi:hypothetical protein
MKIINGTKAKTKQSQPMQKENVGVQCKTKGKPLPFTAIYPCLLVAEQCEPNAS